MKFRISMGALGIITLVLLFAAGLVASCAKPAAGPTTSSTPAPAPTTSLPATPTSTPAPTIWKLDTSTTFGNFDGDLVQEFARTVYDGTNGRLKIDVYPRSSLGLDVGRTLRNLKEGVIDIATVPAFRVGGEEPSFLVTETPGVWKGADDVIKAGDIMAAFKKKVYRDVWSSEFLNWAPYGDTGIGYFWYRGPKWERLSDMKGKKVRVTNAVQAKQLTLLGASPEVASTVDWYMMQKTGVVTGGYVGASAAVDLKIYEISEFGLEFDYAYAVSSDLVVSGKNWNALSADVQAVIRDAARVWHDKSVTRRQSFTQDQERNPKFLNQMREKGIEIHRWSAEDSSRINEAGLTVLTDYLKEAGGRPVTGDRVKEAFELIRPVWTETGVLK